MAVITSSSVGARYFYLSYVPVPTREERFLGDPWVRRFYHDLNAAINGQPGDRLRLDGFADFIVRRPEERAGKRKDALAEAEVFLPLYSPDYLNREEMRKEREAFRQKLINADRPPDGDNMLPVLWMPLHSPFHSAERDRALAVAADIEPYATNGMSALCRMRIYHSAYQAVLGRLARHIVSIAERFPLSPAQPAQEPVDVPSYPSSEVPFVAVLLAPDPDESPYDRVQLNGYFGTRAGRWRPFVQAPPIIGDVNAAVQRLRMPIETAEFVPDGGLFENSPGLLMIDPYVVATKDGPETVRAAAECLRNWVGVAIILDENGPGHGATAGGLIDQVKKMLPAAANVSTFTNHDDWRIGIHNLVERMRRRYLDGKPAHPPKGPPPPRPRLFEGRPPPDDGPDDQPEPGTE